MIAFVIFDINVCGGTHKQLLKLLEYTERQEEDFIIITKNLDLDKTYEGYKRYKDKIKVYDCYNYPNIFRHSIIRRLIPAYNKWKLRRYIKKCDIVNIHDNGFEELYPLLNGKKVFWQVNDLHCAFRVGVSSGDKDTEWAGEQRNYILKHSKSFEAITVNVAKNARRIKECMGRDAQVYYCGVEPVNITRTSTNTFQRFQNKQLNLLTSGVFFPYRNYETQVEVVKTLIEKGYDVKLNIIGDTSRDGEYHAKIQNLIDFNNLHDTIIIEGQVSNQRYQELHSNADLFLFINIDQSWGLAVFEAQSCGLPVLVSNSVGATEILNDNEDSILVEPHDAHGIADKIIELANDKDYYLRISNNASGFHKEWTWDKAYCSKMFDLMMRR